MPAAAGTSSARRSGLVMKRHYAPRTFLRHVPKALLERFFRRHSLLGGLAWDALADGDIDPIYEVWQALPAPDRERVEMLFREADGLATPEGVRILVEEGRFHGVDL